MSQPALHNGSYKAFFDGLLKGTIKAESLHGDGTAQLWYVDPEAPDVVAVGGIYQTMSNVNPGLPTAAGGLGYGTWALIAPGRVLLGVAAGVPGQDAPNLTLGAAQVTPAGAVAPPVFTGQASQSTNSVSAGTPAGSNTQPTFTGSALPAHAHELPVQLSSTTATRQIAAATFGTGTSRAATGASAAGSSNTTSAAVALSQSVSAGTPAGTCSAPVFVGQTLTGHAHTITPAGTNSAPAFTGAALSVVQPSLTVNIWTRTA